MTRKPTLSSRYAALKILIASRATSTVNAIRKYGVVTLKNGLEVFLTYDPTALKSAASLAVGTGSLYDPADKPGLAHLLEHMLFLGTTKYPTVGQYQQFIGQNNGEANAYTADDITNLALFLASDDSRTITGQSINCDAGAVMIG